MKSTVLFGVFLLLIEANSTERTFLDNFNYFIKRTQDLFITGTGSPSGLRRAGRIHKLQPPISNDKSFMCDTSNSRSRTPPTSVHELRPGDFDIIAAIGDSLTAAHGAVATRTVHVLVENRGLSWSIGGQGTWREHLTLPNIIKEFNPKLFGFSKSDSFAFDRAAQFNVAEGGSMSRDMPYMATVLVKRIRADKRVNFDTDWKLVTLLIGGNDFCSDVCYRRDPSLTPEIHRKDLFRTLDYLRDNLPRTFVNLVVSPNVAILNKFKRKKTYCEAIHIITCPCLVGKAKKISQKRLESITRRWQQVDEEVSMDKRYQNKKDFAVTLQPFVADLVLPERPASDGLGNETDLTYLSEDCFHFSQKGYARASNALWNNMMEPVGRKSTNWEPEFSRFNCPTEEHPYVFTYRNSGPIARTRQIL